MNEWVSFRICLEGVLDGRFGELPEPATEDDPLVFWRHWLARHNLGLVPVADADRFMWPGKWIALVSDETRGASAVLMFGSPPGPIFDPNGVTKTGTHTIDIGYVVSPLDFHLDRVRPYGGMAEEGVVAAVMIAPDAGAPLVRVESARAFAGRGLKGDRYAERKGTFSGRSGYDITLIEAEALEQLAKEERVAIEWEDARRNIVTRGIDLNALVGGRFMIGEVECAARRLAEPCAHLERLSRPGVLRGLVHRAGIRCDILASGKIRLGAKITPVEGNQEIANSWSASL